MPIPILTFTRSDLAPCVWSRRRSIQGYTKRFEASPAARRNASQDGTRHDRGGIAISIDGQPPAAASSSVDGSTELDEVFRLEQERCRAISECDWAALGSLLHDNFTYGFLSGRIEDKQTYLAGIPGRPHRHARSDIAAHSYAGGTVVVMTGGFVSSTPEHVVTNVGTALQVWVKERGEWKLAAISTTRTTPPGRES
jgi:hypothetical protein